ncbi:T9SS type A sorting domain-containing protein [Nibribacter koreensis]|uniref:Por secretion system C-terminal sorting domain-containing protein n=1 Tax=Nibribacter koreensis TaxID=1084519 RepID=A0ABP8FF91_9BACT
MTQQNGCDESKPTEIVGSFVDPCHGQVLTYSVVANPEFNSYVWEMPRSTTGDITKDWVIISGQGTNSIRVRTGEKNGTIKLTVKHNKCGTKVQTTPVTPKNGCVSSCTLPDADLQGPEVICYIYEGGLEGEPFIPYVYSVTNPVEGAVYDFILPEGFIPVGGGEGEPFIEVLSAFDLSTEDANPSMPGVQQVITVVSSYPDRACVSDMSSLFVTLQDENCEPAEPLPVELVMFEGISRRSGIELAWSTATEIENDRFEVQRSLNGKEFTTIGEVKGAGNSSILLSYKYMDRQAPAGTIYYRLNQIDWDKAHEYSKVIAVQHTSGSSAQGLKVKLFPNPITDGQLSVQVESMPEGQSEFTLQLLDMNGKLLYSNTMLGSRRETSLGLRNLGLRQGLYVVSVSSGAESKMQRIVIQ